jgi:DNA modification methylase
VLRVTQEKWINHLHYGDCLRIMNDMPKNYVDLVYLDPPFNSNREYAAIYEDDTGRPLPEQIDAFEDLWELSDERLHAIQMMPVLMRSSGIKDEDAQLWELWMRALRKANPRLLAYLSYMTERLLPLRSIVKPTGSIYLHCDPTASHYIKAMMDAVFGHENFRNEIIWKRTGAHGRAKRWGPIHDTILFYSKSSKYTWNRTLESYSKDYLENAYSSKDSKGAYQPISLTGPGKRTGSSGKPWRGVDPTDSGRHWELPPDRALPDWFIHPDGYSKMDVQERLDVLDEAGLIYWPPRGRVPRFKRYAEVAGGNPIQDIISDIGPLGAHADERLGYPTQKPVALLERIIHASTNKGERVLDPFCGCATTIEAAHRLGREWIGIDVAIHAIRRVAQVRLEDRLGLKEGVDFTVTGIPESVEGAKHLWGYDKHQFQKWAIEQVDGFVTAKKTADGGIDGRLYFYLPNQADLESMVIEVKGGKNVNKENVRSLRGVLERDEATMAGLIVMDDLGDRKTKNFHTEMGEAGFLDVSGVQYPRMQMLTVAEILAGKRFLTPTVAKAKMVAQPSLPLGR